MGRRVKQSKYQLDELIIDPVDKTISVPQSFYEEYFDSMGVYMFPQTVIDLIEKENYKIQLNIL